MELRLFEVIVLSELMRRTLWDQPPDLERYGGMALGFESSIA